MGAVFWPNLGLHTEDTTMTTARFFMRHFTLTLVGTVFATGAALAAPSNTLADAQARYRQDMAFCDSGQSSQGVATCKTEARNAFAEAKRGGLSDAPDQYTRNAVARCAAFKGDDRSACEARVLSPSRVEGSVDGGGVLRESTVVVPVQ